MPARTTPVTPLVPGSIAEHALCALTKLGQVSFRLSEVVLLPLGLRVRHYTVLQALDDNGPLAQLDLASLLRIDTATMVATIDDLEGGGHATRRRDPDDRRRSLVELTASGAQTLKKANSALEVLETQALAGLSPAQRRQLATIIRTLSDDGPFLALNEARISNPR